MGFHHGSLTMNYHSFLKFLVFSSHLEIFVAAGHYIMYYYYMTVKLKNVYFADILNAAFVKNI